MEILEVKKMEKISEINVMQYYFSPSSLINSEVVSTLTFDCILKAFSSDQIAQFDFNANAKYSISFECGEISLASEILSMKSSSGINLILNFIILIKLSKSSCENPDLNLISSRLFSSSASILNGVKKSVASEKNIHIAAELNFLPIITEKTRFASIINLILELIYAMPFSSSSLEMPLETFFPNSKASFSVNLLLDANASSRAFCNSFDLESRNSNAFAFIASSATLDQSTSGNSLILFSNSFDNCNIGILLPFYSKPNLLYKPFVQEYLLR